MIGHHRVDQAVRKPSPQPVPVRGFPDRRAALVLGGPLRHLLRAERQVMRTGLDGDPYPLRPRRRDGGQRARRGQVQDVDARIVPPGGLQQALDRRVLGRGGPGGEEVRVRPARWIRGRRDDPGVFRVHDQQRIEPGQFGEGGVQPHRVKVPAEDPATVQPGQGGEVVRDRAAPEADIHPWSPAGGGPLEPQRVGRGGGRHAVERHVDQGGDAAGGSRPGRGREALPIGAARFVDVDVGVDQPRQQHLSGGQLFAAGRIQDVCEPGQCGDPAGPHRHGDRAHAIRRDRPAGPDRQLILSHLRCPAPPPDHAADSQPDTP